jgi:hypothetical protein
MISEDLFDPILSTDNPINMPPTISPTPRVVIANIESKNYE